MKPTVGRIVQIILPKYPLRPIAAIVTEAAGEAEVVIQTAMGERPAIGLTTFVKPGWAEVMQSSLWLPNEPEVKDAYGRYWRWPPREE